MLKIKDLHLGRVVLINTTPSQNKDGQVNEKIGIVYQVDEVNETCCVIDCNSIAEDQSAILKQILKQINGNKLNDLPKKFVRINVSIKSVETLPERLLFYTRKMNEVVKVLMNKEAAAAVEDKFMVDMEQDGTHIQFLRSRKTDMDKVLDASNNGFCRLELEHR